MMETFGSELVIGAMFEPGTPTKRKVGSVAGNELMNFITLKH